MPFQPTELQLRILQTLDRLQNEPFDLLSPRWKPTGETFRFVCGVPDRFLCAAVKSEWSEMIAALPALFSRQLIERTEQFVAWMTEREKRFRLIADHGVVARWTFVTDMDMLQLLSNQLGVPIKTPPKSRRTKKPIAPAQPPCVLEQIQSADLSAAKVRLSQPFTRTHTSRKIAHIKIVAKGLDLLDELDAKWKPDSLVNLSQVAALMGGSKRTLERWLKDGKLPAPDRPGGGGRAHKWYWRALKRSLEDHTKRVLPNNFPGDHIVS